MIEEIWRPIEGYEGLYEVSNTGKVRSLDRYDNRNCFRKGKVLSPIKDTDDYLKVNLYCNGKNKKCLVHRLVALTFIPNPDGLPQGNHKDEDKTNNNVDNLEWCNRKYNVNYGSRKDKVKDTAIKNGYWTGLSKEEYMKEYREKNREKTREYREKNREKTREYNREYYEKNREKHREYMREYRKKRKNK